MTLPTNNDDDDDDTFPGNGLIRMRSSSYSDAMTSPITSPIPLENSSPTTQPKPSHQSGVQFRFPTPEDNENNKQQKHIQPLYSERIITLERNGARGSYGFGFGSKLDAMLVSMVTDPPAKGVLLVGDIIKAFNGQSIAGKTPAELLNEIAPLPKLEILISRPPIVEPDRPF